MPGPLAPLVALGGKAMAAPLSKWLVALFGASMLKDVGMGLRQTGLQHSLGKRQIGLQKGALEGETEAARLTNEENRRQAQQFTAMLASEKTEGRKERSQDRQMQLLLAMLTGMGQMRESAVDTFTTASRPLPPTALTSLMRGR